MILFYVLSNAFNFTFSQELFFEQLTARDGLPAMECYHIVQDKKGYIWTFTEYGIVKHNGEKFISVCTNIPLNDQTGYSIFQTEEGEMYFANSQAKIFKIKNDSAFSISTIERFTSNFQGPAEIIYQMMVDNDENIYFNTYKNSYIYKYTEDRVEKIAPELSLDTAIIIFKKMGNIMFPFKNHPSVETQNNIIVQIESEKLPYKKLTLNTHSSIFSRMQVERIDGDYYISNSNEFLKIDQQGKILSKKVDQVIGFKTDKKNNIWLITQNGILVLDKNLEFRAHYLPGVTILDICFDNQDGLWATTIGQGVFHCRNIDEVVYNYSLNIYNEILFLKKNGNFLFFSSGNGGCYKLTSDSPIINLHQFDGPMYCMDINELNDDVFLSTKSGLFVKNKTTGVLKKFGTDHSKPWYSVGLELIDKNFFVNIAATSLGVVTSDSSIKTLDLKYKIQAFVRFDRNHMLIGLKQGLVLYNFNTNTSFPYQPFFKDKNISVLKFDPDSNLWIAAKGNGIYRIARNNKIAQVLYLPFLVVNDIDFFDTDKLIVSTNMGVFTTRYSAASVITNWNNIMDDEANAVEVFNGKLWMATASGLHSIQLVDLYKTRTYPIIISSVYANNYRVLDHTSALRHNENNLRFNFDFLDYKKRVKKFYFTLKGPTNLSGTISGNVLQIQNLKPGNYTLKVYPFHGPVFEKDHFILKKFTIYPAFWQTLWFKITWITLLILFTALMVTLFFTQKQKRKQRQIKINKLLAEHKLTALKAQINPHFISNSLSAVQQLVDSGEVDKTNQYLAKFSLLIRYVLKYSDKSIAKLCDEIQIIDLNIELEQLRFNHSFEYIKEIDPSIDTEEIYIPSLITQPFIENAIWHGLLPLKGLRKPRLIFKIHKKNNDILISIIDNGVGLKNKKLNARSAGDVHESIGSALTSYRIKNMNDLYNLKGSSVVYTDLLDENNQPAGTQVDIILTKELLNKLHDEPFENFNS